MTRAEHKLLHPTPGSRVEAARAFGIDLSMVVERLRLTPEERLNDLESVMADLDEMMAVFQAHGKAKRNTGPAGTE